MISTFQNYCPRLSIEWRKVSFPSSDVQKEIYNSLRAEHPEYAVYETDAELAIEYLKRHPTVSGLTGEGAYVLYDGDEDKK